MNLSEIVVRASNESDCWTIWQLRYDSSAIPFFGDTDTVDFEEHKTWYMHKIASSSDVWLISELQDQTVGFVRFSDMYPEHQHPGMKKSISIVVDPQFRGQGVGQQILQESLRWYRSHEGSQHVLCTDILVSNLAAQKVFERCGFVIVDQVKKRFHYEMR